MTTQPSKRGTVLLDHALFPLSVVLFPGSLLPLRLFEARYLDMAREAMRNSVPFGIVLIDQGHEGLKTAQKYAAPERNESAASKVAAKQATLHRVGTLATIADWDMETQGILSITALAGTRFQIENTHVSTNSLLRGDLQLLGHQPMVIDPEHYATAEFLRKVMISVGKERFAGSPETWDFDDASWVGYRLAEILPLRLEAKQRLLELEDHHARLIVLDRFLREQQLIG